MFMCADIHDFYYTTCMVDFNYTKPLLSMFPQGIVQQYNLKDLVAADGYFYMKIRKGITGLKQTGRLASNRLTKNLARNGYIPLKHTPYLWRHHTTDLVSSLVVNDLVIKYKRKEYANHMLKSLWEDYNINEDWTDDKYLGLTLKWDYANKNVRVFIPGYVKVALLKFQCEVTKKLQYALHPWNQPMYGAKTHYADTDTAKSLDAQSTLYA